MKTLPADAPCPCGRLDESKGKNGHAPVLTYGECCGPLHGAHPVTGPFAPDAHSLMRARYSAYVLENIQFLLNTWERNTRPPQIEFEPGIKWLGLQVRSYCDTGPGHAEVEFVARYKLPQGPAVRLHEHSRFNCGAGQWLYVDGDTL